MFWRKNRRTVPDKPDLRFIDPTFRRRRHVDADWSGQTFDQFIPVGCRFEACLFENVNFKSACFGGGAEDSYYVGCSFDRATIRSIAPGYARFESCTFYDIEIVQFLAMSIEMVDCVVTGIIKQAFFNGAVPDEDVSALGRSTNEFRGNDFSGATLLDVDFRTGIDLSAQRMPKDWRTET